MVLAVKEIAVEMENPFGFETNDLPLDSLHTLIQTHLRALASVPVQADMLRILDESKQMEIKHAEDFEAQQALDECHEEIDGA
eukprot:6420727-Prymnesium_polylepis.2